MAPLRSLIYDAEKPSLQVLDQLALPHEMKYVDVPDVETAWAVIREMSGNLLSVGEKVLTSG